MKKNLIIILLLSLFCITASAAGPLSDPEIPDEENIRYKITSGKTITYSSQLIRSFSDDKGKFYIITSSSDEQESEIHIRANGMVPFSSITVYKSKDSEYSTETILKNPPQIKDNHFFVIGMEDVPIVLRGFPFKKSNTLKVQILGQTSDDGKNSFSMKLKHIKDEKIKINGQSYLTHKIELITELPGVMSLFSGFIPKIYFWLSTQPSHYLIKYEGVVGFGGSDKRIIEILN